MQKLTEQWPHFLPGLNRIIAIGGADDPSAWLALDYVGHGANYVETHLELNEQVAQDILRQQQEKAPFRWLTAGQLPFAMDRSQLPLGQLSMFEEANHLILAIRVSITQKSTPDLFYLFFRSDKSQFGIHHDHQPLDTSQKMIIGQLVHQHAQLYYRSALEMENRYNRLKEHAQGLLNHQISKQKEQDEEKTDWKKHWVLHYLSEISQRDGLHYVYREEALELLLNNSHSMNHIRQAIEDACEFARLLANEAISSDCYIEEQFIKFTSVTTRKVKESPSTQQMTPRMDKTYHLLDRLEEAALKVMEEGQSLTSKQVGLYMDQPITAPAIRDALKKNRIRVLQLFEDFPNRWSCIRHYFRPVTNLYPREFDRQQGIG
jgi:hypothetical protein